MIFQQPVLWDATCYHCGNKYNPDGTGHKTDCPKCQEVEESEPK